MIPDEAVEAAARVIREKSLHSNYYPTFDAIEAILEAALPILLSHEREETRLAHLDAVVNAGAVDRLEGELAQAKANAWDEGMWFMYNTTSSECPSAAEDNPYRK